MVNPVDKVNMEMAQYNRKDREKNESLWLLQWLSPQHKHENQLANAKNNIMTNGQFGCVDLFDIFSL